MIMDGKKCAYIDETDGWLTACLDGNIKNQCYLCNIAMLYTHSVTLIQFYKCQSVCVDGRTLCHATNIVENLDILLIIIIIMIMMMMMHKHIHCNLELH